MSEYLPSRLTETTRLRSDDILELHYPSSDGDSFKKTMATLGMFEKRFTAIDFINTAGTIGTTAGTSDYALISTNNIPTIRLRASSAEANRYVIWNDDHWGTGTVSVTFIYHTTASSTQTIIISHFYNPYASGADLSARSTSNSLTASLTTTLTAISSANNGIRSFTTSYGINSTATAGDYIYSAMGLRRTTLDSYPNDVFLLGVRISLTSS